MVRAMCDQKVVDRIKMTVEQIDMLGLQETIDRLATANGARWYGHVLRRETLGLKMSGKRKRELRKNNLKEASGGGDRE